MRVRLAVLAASVASVGGGVGWWVHPGAGVAVAGVLGGAWAMFWSDER